jgi:hypothetical protein
LLQLEYGARKIIALGAITVVIVRIILGSH